MAEEKECCPKFDPEPWDGKTREWKDKPFLTRTIPQLFHMPLPGVMGRAIGSMWAEAEKAGIAPNEEDFLLLAHDPSPWRSELFMAVTGMKPGADDACTLSGTFVSKAFDGPYQNIPKYIAEAEAFLKTQGRTAKKWYFYYTTCPKCAKKYGHNWIVALAEV